MKQLFKYLVISTCIFLLYIGCDKKDSVPYYPSGVASVISMSSDSVVLTANDSSVTVLKINWTNPHYGNIDSTTQYILQIDSVGGNFSQPYADTINGKLGVSFTASQLNNLLLFKLGLSIYSRYKIEARVISAYANGNNLLVSNTASFKAFTYAAPAIVPPPTTDSLYIVGSATQGGWANPVPTPSQKFTQVDSLTYVGTFALSGGGEYLFLPLNGDWGNKYAVSDNTIPALNKGGAFGFNFNDNFPGPDSTGNYQIKADFLHGKFTVTKQ